jgi:hypothetical protein
LGNTSQDQTGFQETKVISDTLARANAEGDVSVSVPGSRALRSEALGIKTIGIVPKGWMSMKGIDADGDYGASRDMIIGNLVVTDGAATNDPGWREKAQAFI